MPEGGWRACKPWAAVSAMVLLAMGALGYTYFSNNYPCTLYGAFRMASGFLPPRSR